MAKKLTVQQLKKIQPQDIPGRKDISKLRSMVTQARELYTKREASLKKAHLSWSPALEKLKESKVGERQVNKMSTASLQAELIRIQQFFQARTATAAGAREVMREQDASIFGVDYTGNPLFRMTRKERDMFWETYEKYYETYASHANFTGSNQLKILLGDWVRQRRSNKIKPEKVGADILATIEKMNEERNYGGETVSWNRPNIKDYTNSTVWSGTWDDIARGYTGKNNKPKK